MRTIDQMLAPAWTALQPASTTALADLIQAHRRAMPNAHNAATPTARVGHATEADKDYKALNAALAAADDADARYQRAAHHAGRMAGHHGEAAISAAERGQYLIAANHTDAARKAAEAAGIFRCIATIAAA